MGHARAMEEGLTMKVVVNIPIKISLTLFDQCDRNSREYETIANGLILGEQLSFQCEREFAIHLVAWAEEFVGGAAKQIEVVQ